MGVYPNDRELHHHVLRGRSALVQMGVEPIAAHFFVFYYGVLADITPPVALPYAAAGMANSIHSRQVTLRLAGSGKALVPFVFVVFHQRRP